ncbi:tRNA (adenosine(37)-N6)-threonylcarbamoyltransferase complex ATPase subunit type 1 TsaE [bacterium]|nr:tRNA (adenosine(37)-N6)-threonylcarbamoyltransferase complex ATPase subunit type 1 TsaE [bacterium]
MKVVFAAEMKSENELRDKISLVAEVIQKNSIILLSGNLSAGKTTFVNHFCNHLKLNMVQSPTYAIHQRYSNASTVVDHFDLYRLEDEDQIQSSGFYDLLNTPADYKFIEWPERINTADLPMEIPIFKINFEKTSENSRKIEILRLS